MKISPQIRDMILAGSHAPGLKAAMKKHEHAARGRPFETTGITSYEEMLRVIV